MRDGVRVAVRVTPRAGRAAIGEVADDGDGSSVLRVAVTAVPEGGKANRAVIDLLAKSWRLPKSSIRVVSGASARRKVLQVAGEPTTLMQDLSAWLEKRSG